MHVVIINNKFPPNQGIGGRRMALLAKYLLGKGHSVSVICQKPYSDNKMNLQWLSQDDQEKVHYVFVKNKNYLNQAIFSNQLLVKIFTPLLRWLFNILHQGNIYDSSLFQQSDILSALTKIHNQHRIDWIIATAAPFNLLYYSAIFKKRFPDVRLCCDIRDPWLKNDNYGYQNLSSRRKEIEKNKMRFVLQQADLISSPHPSCLREMAPFCELPDKLHLIEHCYEQESVHNTNQDPKLQVNSEKNTIKFVYAGTIYPKCEAYFQQLNTHLQFIKKEHPALYQKFSFHIYSDDYAKMKPLLKDHAFHFSPAIGSAISTPLEEADYIIIMVNDSMKDLYITKVFDYSVYQKPYAFLGAKGELIAMLEQQKIGMEIGQILENYWDPSLPAPIWNLKEFKQHFSFEAIGQKWMQQLTSPNL